LDGAAPVVPLFWFVLLLLMGVFFFDRLCPLSQWSPPSRSSVNSHAMVEHGGTLVATKDIATLPTEQFFAAAPRAQRILSRQPDQL